MRISYKIQDKFDFGIFLPVFFLILIGLTAIYSSTYNHPTASGNFERQVIWMLIALTGFFVIYFLPGQTFKLLTTPSYIISILLLIVVLVVGKKVYGARSWLVLTGQLGFQPSEIAKIGTIFLLARWLTEGKEDINNIKDIGVALLIGFFPIALILLEPDMGTAIVFSIITLTMIFWSGISLFGLFVVLSPGIVIFASIFGTVTFIFALLFVLIALVFFRRNLFTSATIFVINLASGFFFEFGFGLLKPHQQKRIEAFIDPSADPLGSGYNALQAKVAIGSGGFFGKGFLEGNQTQLRFIPEQWTDFIYCVAGEEFGFIGSVLILILFLILFLKLLNIASSSKNKFNSLVIIGILSTFFIHFAINIGMNVGIAPVIGLPLPFVSYGGSSLLVNMALLGIVANIYRNRKMHA